MRYIFLKLLFRGWSKTVKKEQLESGDFNQKEKTNEQLLEEKERRIFQLENYVEDLSKQLKELKATKTIEVREGRYSQQIIRHGKKKKETLKRFPKNPAKLSIGYFGNLEFFMYPYSSFKKFYVRDGVIIHGFDNYDPPRLMALFNKIRWVIENGKSFVTGKIDSESSLAIETLNAFNMGLQKELIRTNELKKSEQREMVERIEGMKPQFRERFLEDDPELRKLYNQIKGKKKSKKRG